MRPARAALLLAALAAAACSRVRHVPEDREAPKAEAPDAPEERGIPAAPGRPGVPASPEALLAEGAVGRIQRALAERGLLGRHREGELDEATSAAIGRFQRDAGLAATGFPDRQTLERLGIRPESAYGTKEDRARQREGRRGERAGRAPEEGR